MMQELWIQNDVRESDKKETRLHDLPSGDTDIFEILIYNATIIRNFQSCLSTDLLGQPAEVRILLTSASVTRGEHRFL